MSQVPSRKVSSSESGDLRKAPAQATPEGQSQPRGNQVIVLHSNSKGRVGNGVIALRGLTLPEAELVMLAKSLKQSRGVGGTTKNRVIQIQGQARAATGLSVRQLWRNR